MVFVARRRAIWEVIVVAAAYYATARLGLLLQLPGTSVSAVWPPSGIGLAAVLLLGPRVWPAITVAAFFAYSATLPLASVDNVVTAAVIAAGHTLEPLTAWALITRVSGMHNPFERAGYALWFGSATVVAGIVSATIGVTALHLDGLISRDIYETAWLTWLVGDVAGMIVLAPAIYAWGRNPSLRVSVSRGVELAVMLGVSLLVGEMVFGRLGTLQVALSRPYQPVLLWAAFRFGQRETSTLGVIASVQAVTHTWAAMSVPAAGSATAMATLLLGASATPHDWLRALQFFLCSTVTVGLIVAAAVAERDKSKRELADSERRFRTVFEQAAVGVALVDSSTGRFLRVNQRYGDIVGYTPEQMCALRFQENYAPRGPAVRPGQPAAFECWHADELQPRKAISQAGRHGCVGEPDRLPDDPR
jgi:integral membrane sensor domain MASE1